MTLQLYKMNALLSYRTQEKNCIASKDHTIALYIDKQRISGEPVTGCIERKNIHLKHVKEKSIYTYICITNK